MLHRDALEAKRRKAQAEGGYPRPVSVCCTNYNTAPVLEAFLTTTLEQLPPDGEVVVVDGGSTDGSWEILQAFAEREPTRVTVDRADGCTRGMGRELAFERSGGRVIVQLDTDRPLRPGTLDRLLEEFERRGGEPYLPWTPDAAMSGFVASADDLIDVGGWDVTLTYFEDQDLVRRLRAQGHPVGTKRFEESLFQENWRGPRRPWRLARYHFYMYRDAARVDIPYGKVASNKRLTALPLLLVGAIGHAVGRRMEKAEFLKADPTGSTE